MAKPKRRQPKFGYRGGIKWVILNLKPETTRWLRREAAVAGITVDEVLLRIAQEATPAERRTRRRGPTIGYG
jgi:hypothetical protein